MNTCSDCAVAVGEPHEDGCDVARCLWTGGQRLQCDGELTAACCKVLRSADAYELADDLAAHLELDDPDHNCGQDIWTGEWPGPVGTAVDRVQRRPPRSHARPEPPARGRPMGPRREALGETMSRVKGHAWRGVETNVYDDHRYVCECGDRGLPGATIELCREDHRAHKARVERNGRDPVPNMIQRVETRERREMWEVLQGIGVR